MIVYKITNKINQKSYIGSTNNFERRMMEHKQASISSSNPSYNYPLQKSMRKYGLDNFSFEIIESNIPEDKIAEREKYYINFYNTLTNTGNGYNQTIYTDCALRDPQTHQKQIEQLSQPVALVDKNNNIIQTFYSINEASRYEGFDNGASSIKSVCDGDMYSIHNHIYRYIKNNEIVVPILRTRPRYKAICGISIYNKNDIVFYDSVSDAARQEKIVRGSISKCVSGSLRYTHVGGRIWREWQDNIVDNGVDIDTIIYKYSGYCSIDVDNNIEYYDNLQDISKKTGHAVATIKKYIGSDKKMDNKKWYKLSVNREIEK